MATKTTTYLLDDLTGGPADETVPFALDGVSMEIDLSEANATALRNALSDYIEHARRVPRGRATVTQLPRSGGATAKIDPIQSKQMRIWGRAHGWVVSDRGRLPAGLEDAYHGREAV